MTLTNNRTEKRGKSSVEVRSATVIETQEIEVSLNKARDEVQRLEQKKAALAKWSVQERELLGIHVPESAPSSVK